MRMLILGTGGMAKNHAKHFAAIEGVEVVGGVLADDCGAVLRDFFAERR